MESEDFLLTTFESRRLTGDGNFCGPVNPTHYYQIGQLPINIAEPHSAVNI